MKFSIILATLNRGGLVKKAILSILEQEYKNFEIIVVDQSKDDDTKNVVENFKEENNQILYYKVDFKGLSKARNFGIEKATGDYICLMDDDAEYDQLFLQNAYRILNDNSYSILAGIIKEKKTNKVFMPLMDKIDNVKITYQNINICCSASLIINKSALIEIGLFDENLGAGAYYGAGEETDLLFRFLDNDFIIYYTQSILVYHPYPINNVNENSFKRAYSYALGEGALCKKLIKTSKCKKIFIKRYIKNIFKTIGAITIYLFNNRQRYFYYNRLKGLIEGFVKYN